MKPEEGYEEALKRIEKAAHNAGDLLSLSGLDLKELPSELFELIDLQHLSLPSNKITELPEAIGKLKNLLVLDLSDNEITVIPEILSTLINLERLYLTNNKVTAIPEALGDLKNLQALDLEGNKITALPNGLGNLESLVRLDLTANEISNLPETLAQLSKLKELYLQGNTGLGIPAEVLGPTWGERITRGSSAKPSDILEYYFRTRKKKRPLNEAKLILVGRGAVGKTSLARKLIFNKFDPKEKKTEGINIDRWEVPIEGEKVRLNVWDFGGQGSR